MSAKEDSGPQVAVGVICRHGLLLAAQRPDEKPLGGYWELPGGKLEANESPEEALRRELAEELGIKVESCAPLETARTRYKGTGASALGVGVCCISLVNPICMYSDLLPNSPVLLRK